MSTLNRFMCVMDAANEEMTLDKFVLKDASGTVQCVVWSSPRAPAPPLQVRDADQGMASHLHT